MQYEQAIPFLREAEKCMNKLVKDRLRRKHLHQVNNRWLGEALLGLKRYREAERYLEKAVMDAHELEPLWFLECLDVFRSCLEQTGSRPLSKRQSKKHAQKWEKALQSNTVEQYIQFLKAYPNSEHADVAKSQIRALNKQKR